jgi:hypothetical protein
MSKISVKVVKPGKEDSVVGSASDIILEISVHDASLIGRSAKLTINRSVIVKDSRPKNENDKIERSFVIGQSKIQIPLNRKHLRLFSYAGKNIDISVNITLTVDTGILFDTKVNVDTKMDFAPRLWANSIDANEVIEPEDSFSFIENMKAIPSHARAMVFYIFFLAGIFLTGNTAIGIHDQSVSESMTWVYSHYRSNGKKTSPFGNAMLWNASATAAAWLAIRRELRKYMQFRLHTKLSMFEPGAKFQVKELISGAPRVPLKSAELRIVACNMEKGSYWRDSGRHIREEEFVKPVRAFTLYKKKVFNLPAGQEINVHFPEVISFDEIYKKLYPAQMLTKTHGIDIHWEVQLLHDSYVDQELIGPIAPFKYHYFLDQNDAKGDDLGVIDLDPQENRQAG